jgi:Mn2+/Fe2+ NRAMP family transporter
VIRAPSPNAACAVAEAFQWREGLAKTSRQAPRFNLVIGVATLVGMLLNRLHVNPIAAQVYSAIINGVVAVPLVVLIMLVANNHTVMGVHTNGWVGWRRRSPYDSGHGPGSRQSGSLVF